MRRRRVEPVEVESPLASKEAAVETGLIAGLTGGSILDAFTIRHWRRVVAAAREAEHPAPDGPKPAGRLPKGARRN